MIYLSAIEEMKPMRRIVSLILIILISLNIAACAEPGKQRYEAEFLELFDTVTKIVGYSYSEKEFSDDSKMIYDELKIYHQLYDIYNSYEGVNNIKTINDNAGIAPVKVDQRIIDLLKFAKEAYTITEGKVNVAFGSVLSIWHDYREVGIEDPEKAEVPPVELLEEAALHTDINDVVIDEDAGTVFLQDPDMSLDVGAIAKGYATERVTQYAIKHGFTSGIISVGGNVRTIGYKDDKNQLWDIGIQNPDKDSPEQNVFVTHLTNLSLVSSGDYERYYTVDGQRYHHIIDPSTLFPARYFTAVTIICEDSGMADALSTCIFNMPFEDGYKLIGSLPNTEALWIYPNGEVKYTPHFKDFIQ